MLEFLPTPFWYNIIEFKMVFPQRIHGGRYIPERKTAISNCTKNIHYAMFEFFFLPSTTVSRKLR